MALISAGWNPLGENFYRKFELYSMEWDPNLTDLSRYTERLYGRLRPSVRP